MLQRIALTRVALDTIAAVSASSAPHAHEVSTAAAFDGRYGTRFWLLGGPPTLRRERQAPIPTGLTVREPRYRGVLRLDTDTTHARELVVGSRAERNRAGVDAVFARGASGASSDVSRSTRSPSRAPSWRVRENA